MVLEFVRIVYKKGFAMKKIDTHVHAALIRTPKEGGDPRHPEQHYIAAPGELWPHLEAQGIGHAVLMSSGESEGPIGGADNVGCRAIAAAHPERFSWMCNFDAKEPATVADRMARCKAQGAVGVGELAINEWMDSPMLQAVFGAAALQRLPVTIHMSPRPGVSYGVCDHWGLPLLEQTLAKYPQLTLVGHSQLFWMEISGDCPKDDSARSGYGRGPVRPGGRVPALLDRHPNLYADLSAYSASCAILRDEAFGLAFLEKYQDRLFYATDTLNHCQTFPLGKFLDGAAADGRLSAGAYQKICRDNAQRVYGL